MAMALTVVLATLPNFHPEGYLGFSYSWQLDVLIHAGYYFLLTVVLRFYVFKQSHLLLYGILIFSLSLALELLQVWVPKRSLTLLDICSNLMGVFLACMLILTFKRRSLLKLANETKQFQSNLKI